MEYLATASGKFEVVPDSRCVLLSRPPCIKLSSDQEVGVCSEIKEERNHVECVQIETLMDTGGIQDVIRDLSDLELAALVCLLADQHCIITAPEKLLDDLEAEIQLSAVNTFALTCATINCSPSITTSDFSEAVVVENDTNAGDEVRCLRLGQLPL